MGSFCLFFVYFLFFCILQIFFVVVLNACAPSDYQGHVLPIALGLISLSQVGAQLSCVECPWNLIKRNSWQSETYSSSDETLGEQKKTIHRWACLALVLRSDLSFPPTPSCPHTPINYFHTGAFLVLSNSENIGNGECHSYEAGWWNTLFQPISFDGTACAKAPTAAALWKVFPVS